MTDWPRGGRTRSRVADSAHSLIAALSATITGKASTEATPWHTGSSPVTAAIITVVATKQTRHRFPSRRPADCPAGLLVCVWDNLPNCPTITGFRLSPDPTSRELSRVGMRPVLSPSAALLARYLALSSTGRKCAIASVHQIETRPITVVR